jgi:carboxyl-terminal processing protease
MLSALAAPPVLQTREERLAQASADSSSYGGIGAFVTLKDTPEPHIVLLSIMPDSPAEAAGLLAHDSILAIDGEAIAAGDVSLSIEQMRGEPGSEVTLVVRTPGAAEREVVVTRGEIVTTPAEIEIETIGPQENIAYVLFPPAPYANILDGIFAQMETLATEKELAGIIVDLRIVTQNDGWPLAEMFTAFGTGDLGVIYTREETTPLEVEGRDVMMSQTLPMAILVGPDTRGALEMFAAALQSTGRARVLGLPTPGILEGITAFFLPDGSRLFVPTSSYRTADGREVGLDGVVPDILIEAEWDAVTTGDDPVRDAALELLLAETEPAN